MTYARARLWLGISGVGCIVLLSLTALMLKLPQRFFAGSSILSGLAIPLALYILISFPFDLFGGHLLPHWHNRATGTFASFFKAWLRGVLTQASLMGVCGLIILQTARTAGNSTSIIAAGLLMLLLLFSQAPIARIVGGMRIVEHDFRPALAVLSRWKVRHLHPQAYSSVDPGFVGGLVGWPGHERLILPSAWLAKLTPQVVAVQIARRTGVLATGGRLRGVALAFLWNLSGFALSTRLSGSNLGDIEGLLTSSLWFTIWSFGGLLLLPSLSRPAVFESDQFALDRGVSPALIEETIQVLDQLQDNEPARGTWIERIFHPVPSVSSRMRNLQFESTPHGAWQGARTALYLSWACLGFLSRAVHCNSGRPELWVLFPGD